MSENGTLQRFAELQTMVHYNVPEAASDIRNLGVRFGHEVAVELKFLNGCFGEINGDGS